MAEATLDRARAEAARQEKEYRRSAQLLETGDESKQQYDLVKAAYEAARAGGAHRGDRPLDGGRVRLAHRSPGSDRAAAGRGEKIDALSKCSTLRSRDHES